MPPNSPCGMVVDFLRSCHRGRHRFYADDLNILTKGRYYFVPDDTPHLDVPHWFGSGTWQDKGSVPPYPILGEDMSFPTQWTNGFRGMPRPPAVRIGGAGDFADMRQHVEADTRRSIGGVPLECWTNVGTHPGVKFICALEECTLQRLMARYIQLAYDSEPHTIALSVRSWLGEEATVWWQPVEGVFPSYVLIVHPLLTIAVSSGTDNFFQLGTQAATSLQAPTDYGHYGTLPLWMKAASRLNDGLHTAGADPTKPILLAGHSYGGALSTILAVRFFFFNPFRDICLMTFGCPKFGDDRMQAIVDKINHLHIVNDNDIVPYIPATAIEMQQFLGMVLPIVVLNWSRWVGPRTVLELDEEGGAKPNHGKSLEWGSMLRVIQNIIAGVPLPGVNGHDYHEYLRRLKLRCPEDECGVLPPAAWKIAMEGPDGVYEHADLGPEDIDVGVHVHEAWPAVPIEQPGGALIHGGPGVFAYVHEHQGDGIAWHYGEINCAVPVQAELGKIYGIFPGEFGPQYFQMPAAGEPGQSFRIDVVVSGGSVDFGMEVSNAGACILGAFADETCPPTTFATVAITGESFHDYFALIESLDEDVIAFVRFTLV